MTDREIQEARRLTESALQSAGEAERYAAAMVGGNQAGYASHTYTKAKQAVQDLEKLKRLLRTAGRM